MADIQKGPWEIDAWNNIVDANEHLIIITGTKSPSFGSEMEAEIAHANKALIMQAPSLNNVVGKMLDIMSNPYSNNDQRMDKIYNLTEEMRSAYVNGVDYDE